MSVNGSDTPWTPRALELLETLAGLEENLTYREIAQRMTAQLGVTFTKNSCIGRGRRMGLPPRPPKAHRERIPDETPLHTPQAFAPIEPVDVKRKRNGHDLTIIELRDGVCHWPSDGDKPPYTYCGKPSVATGMSWCQKHYRIVCNVPRKTWE